MEKIKLKSKVIYSIIAVFLITIIAVCSYAGNEIAVSVVLKKKLDVILTQKNTSVDISNLKKDLIKALEEKGVDTDLVNIQEINGEVADATNEAAAQTIFNTWHKIGRYPGTWSVSGTTIRNDNNTVDLTGFVYPNYTYTNMDIEYDAKGVAQKNGAYDDDMLGALLRYSENPDGSVSTYLFLLGNSVEADTGNSYSALYQDGSDGYSGIFYSGLYKITHSAGFKGHFTLSSIDGYSKSEQTSYIEPLQRTNGKWERDQNKHYKISLKGNKIEIWEDGIKIIDYIDNNNPILSGGYGLVTYSQEGSFENYKADASTQRSLDEVLLKSTFTERYAHMVIDVDDFSDTDISDDKKFGEILSRMLNDDVHFVAWGNERNKEQFTKFIDQNNHKGMYTDNTNYEEALDKTADYIKNLLEQNEEKSEYVILGENTSLSVVPVEVKKNTADSKYTHGKWRLEHNYKYFENGSGQYENAGKYLNDLPENLNKVGRYELFYADENVLPQYIYTHRRPEAVINLQRVGNEIKLNSESYDLDSTQGNNGILEEEWSYKKTSETEWITGKLTQIGNDEEYIVRLRVKDFQETWSNYATKYITNLPDVLPVAEFSIVENEFSKYEQIKVIDKSYSPQGYEITGWNWVLSKNNSEIANITQETPEFDFETYGTGQYNLKLTVSNIQGMVSREYSRNFTIIEDTEAPEVIITPTFCTPKETQDINLEFKDNASGFSKWRYVFTGNQATPSDGWSEDKTTNKDTITIDTDGDWYLHLQAYDVAGNLMERTVGIYKIRHDYTNTFNRVLKGLRSGDGNFGDQQEEYLINAIQEDVTWGEKFVLDDRYAISAPNGCYKVEKYGTSDIDGTYTLYNYGTETTQSSKGMEFQIDYYPTEYTITYDLAGGKLNGTIPATYNVLYGITYDEPERIGYTFAGWYDQNGNKVTGVNEGKTAEFENAEELYQELAARQTGNIELTAMWEIKELPLDARVDKLVNDRERIVLDWSKYLEEKATYKVYRNDEKQAENEYILMPYLSQPVNVKILVDNEGKDVTAPTKPVIELTDKNVFTYASQERETNYKYYVESYDPADTENKIQTSNIAEKAIESGFKEYRYLFDDEPETVLTATSGKGTPEESITFTRELKYFHIAAVDNEGNVSETATAEIQQYQDYQINYYLQNLDGETYTLDKTVTKNAFIGTLTESEMYEYEGFTTPEIQVEEVDVDVVVIDYYYERNKYTIELDKVEGVDSISGIGTYYYGEELTITAETDDRYQWIGWIGADTISERTHTFIMPAKNLAYTAKVLLKTQVEVKYIDKNTGEELSERVIHKGLYGDEYDVTEDALEIPEYTLIEEPVRAGTMVHAEKTLIYYYAKTQKITVKHLEKDSGEELAEEEIIEIYENKQYKTKEKAIDGYKLVSIAGLFEGTMPRKDLTVVYYYLKETEISIHYIDKNTNEKIADSIIYEGLYGDKYNITKDIIEMPGYTLIEAPARFGTMEKEPQELICYYAKTSKVTARYVEKNTGKSLLQEISIGYEGKKYETEEKTFSGYTFVEKDGQAQGTMTAEPTEVIYYYLKNTLLEVKYLDMYTHEKIQKSDIYEGLYGDPYQIDPKQAVIPGYTIIEEPEITGIMDQVRKEAIYYYAKNSNITIRYVEENTGKDLALMTVISGYQGKEYTERPQEIEGYTLTQGEESINKMMNRENEEKTYYYLKNTSIKIEYKDKKTGEKLAESTVYEGLYGKFYDISKDKKEIENYRVVEKPEETGIMEYTPKTLTYYYNPIVKIKFIDKSTENALVSRSEKEEKNEILEETKPNTEKPVIETIVIEAETQQTEEKIETVEKTEEKNTKVEETDIDIEENTTQEDTQNIAQETVVNTEKTNNINSQKENVKMSITATKGIIFIMTTIVITKLIF